LQQYTLAGIVIITFLLERYIMFVVASFFRARLLVIQAAAHPWWHVEDKRESKNLATIIGHTVGAWKGCRSSLCFMRNSRSAD
jgi:hypothetical protein